MDASEPNSPTGRFRRALDVIGAIAHGDTAPEDIAAQLHNEGLDALDVLVAALAGAARQATDPRTIARPIDVSAFSRATPPELIAQTTHQVPQVPFLLNGTLYDPQDITRFNGRELHLVDMRGELLAFDNRGTIARVWELLYIAPMTDTALASITSNVVHPTGGPMGPAPWPWWPDVDEDEIGAHFYEHSGWDGWGSHLFLPKNRGYWDLRQVCLGFLCSDDWNDKISAMRCWSTPWVSNRVCVLHEHINMQGSSFTNIGPDRECFGFKELNSVGWNDRASSVETW